MTLDDLVSRVQGLTDQGEVREICWAFVSKELAEALPNDNLTEAAFVEAFDRNWKEIVIDEGGAAIDVAEVFVNWVSKTINELKDDGSEVEEPSSGSVIGNESGSGEGNFEIFDDDKVMEISGDAPETNNQVTKSSVVVPTVVVAAPATPVEEAATSKAIVSKEAPATDKKKAKTPSISLDDLKKKTHEARRALEAKWRTFSLLRGKYKQYRKGARKDEKALESKVAFLELLCLEGGRALVIEYIQSWIASVDSSDAKSFINAKRLSDARDLMELLEFYDKPVDIEIRKVFNLLVVPRDEAWRVAEKNRLENSLVKVRQEIASSKTASHEAPEVSPASAQAGYGNGSGAEAQELNIMEKLELVEEILARESIPIMDRMNQIDKIFE